MGRARLVLSCWLALALASAPSRAAEPAGPRRVLVVSIDGLGWEGWRALRDRTPVLNGLALRGVAGPSKTVFPSMTWPSHATLVTGRAPSAHRVVGNRHYDRVKRALVHAHDVPMDTLMAAETIFHAARRAGKKTAALNWPGSRESSSIDFQIPEVYAQKAFDQWSTPGLLELLRAHGVPSQRYGEHAKDEGFVLDAVTRDATRVVVRQHRPEVVWTHFLVLDTLCHKYGPTAPEIGYALEHADAMLGGLLATYEAEGLLADTDVLVVSDHGFVQTKKLLDVDKIFLQAGLIKNLKRLESGPIRTVANGQALYLYVLEPKRKAELLAQASELLKGREEIERLIQPKEYAGLGLPPGSDDRMPDLIALGRPEVRFGRIEKGDEVARAAGGGMHGYLPEHASLRPAFIAAGPRIQKRSDPVELTNLDVAPLVSHLLEVPFAVTLSDRVRTQIVREPAHAQN